MIKKLMRKLGYIAEKDLIDALLSIYDKNSTKDAFSKNGSDFCIGTASAIGYICGRLGICDIIIIQRDAMLKARED